jgi:hypothetical protein
MKRRKRFALKLIALGFASAAIGAPTAQAMPDGMTGEDMRELREARAKADVEARSSRATNRTVPIRRPRRPIRVPDLGSGL